MLSADLQLLELNDAFWKTLLSSSRTSAKRQITVLPRRSAGKGGLICVCCLKGNLQRILVCERLGSSAQNRKDRFNTLGKGQMWPYESITQGGKRRREAIKWLYKPRNEHCGHFTSSCLSAQPPGSPRFYNGNLWQTLPFCHYVTLTRPASVTSARSNRSQFYRHNHT